MDDASYDEWETVSESLGTKLEWNVGTRFVGEYAGIKEVKVDDEDTEDGFSMVDAATFLKDGEHFYSWITYAMKQVIDSGKLAVGQTVFIHCTGEEKTKSGYTVKVFDIKVKPLS
jgi:hypothetical protein